MCGDARMGVRPTQVENAVAHPPASKTIDGHEAVVSRHAVGETAPLPDATTGGFGEPTCIVCQFAMR
jgi:hypothetical protein